MRPGLGQEDELGKQQMTVGLVGLHGKDGHHELADGVLLIRKPM